MSVIDYEPCSVRANETEKSCTVFTIVEDYPRHGEGDKDEVMESHKAGPRCVGACEGGLLCDELDVIKTCTPLYTV